MLLRKLLKCASHQICSSIRLRLIKPSLYYIPLYTESNTSNNISSLAHSYSTSWNNFKHIETLHQSTSLLQKCPIPCCLYNAQRLKSSRSKKKKGDEEESSDDDDEYNDYDENEDNWLLEKGPNFKDFRIKINAIRLDLVAAAGFGISRKQIEKEFYAGKILVNGHKAKKKSQEMNEGDKLDILKKTESDDEAHQILRIILLKIGTYKPGSDKVFALIRKYTKPVSSVDEADQS